MLRKGMISDKYMYYMFLTHNVLFFSHFNFLSLRYCYMNIFRNQKTQTINIFLIKSTDRISDIFFTLVLKIRYITNFT